jgi:DNA end-binding protein Ku
VEKDLLDLAQELIDRKTAPFHPEDFHDKYTDALRELIEAKAKHKTVEVTEEEARPQRGGHVIDLMEALKRSVQRSEGKTPAKSRPRSRAKRAA